MCACQQRRVRAQRVCMSTTQGESTACVNVNNTGCYQWILMSGYKFFLLTNKILISTTGVVVIVDMKLAINQC